MTPTPSERLAAAQEANGLAMTCPICTQSTVAYSTDLYMLSHHRALREALSRADKAEKVRDEHYGNYLRTAREKSALEDERDALKAAFDGAAKDANDADLARAKAESALAKLREKVGYLKNAARKWPNLTAYGAVIQLIEAEEALAAGAEIGVGEPEPYKPKAEREHRTAAQPQMATPVKPARGEPCFPCPVCGSTHKPWRWHPETPQEYWLLDGYKGPSGGGRA